MTRLRSVTHVRASRSAFDRPTIRLYHDREHLPPIFNGHFRTLVAIHRHTQSRIVITCGPVAKLRTKCTGSPVSNVSSKMRTCTSFLIFADLEIARCDPPGSFVLAFLVVKSVPWYMLLSIRFGQSFSFLFSFYFCGLPCYNSRIRTISLACCQSKTLPRGATRHLVREPRNFKTKQSFSFLLLSFLYVRITSYRVLPMKIERSE